MSATRRSDMYTATANVGKDTIENAKYFCFNASDRPKRIKPFKDKMCDLWYSITLRFYKLIRRFKGVYCRVRWGFERMFKGYDSVDCCETFAKFTERYYKIFKQYKKNHHGYPYNMSSDEWESIIDDMIYHLYYMNEENVETELCNNMPVNWTPTASTTYEIMDRHKDEFFKLFSKYFYNLWD